MRQERQNNDAFDQRNKRLCAQAKQGDENAFRELLERNERFYRKMAMLVIEAAGAPEYLMQDLLDEVPECLLEIVEGFDVEKGYAFSTYAGTILRRRMGRMVRFYYRPREISITDLTRRSPDPENGEIIEYEAPDPKTVEPVVVKKIFFEQFQENFRQLEDSQQMVLSYKFGYDAGRPPLMCSENYKTDEEVTAYFHSKASIIRNIKNRAYEEMRRKPFLAGDRKRRNDPEMKRESGTFIKGPFCLTFLRNSD